ncbi:M15 family metallopeptidase [Flavobacterium ardleyense]|uniref:M15 family metallopeptidase n=1 Tax=Flavobacterium ardleyense TaxID=2038737 RepID=UPI00298CE116|nr:M15 family metallopeptidase [Flavobacterium ardleyense]
MYSISKSAVTLILILLSTAAFAQEKDSDLCEMTSKKVNDTTFVNLKDFTDKFIYDLKYATADNFLKEVVYDCAECYLRLKTVKALLIASELVAKDGYKIKLFDCYRSLDVQKKMWKIVNNPSYVANPKTGSVHNRGKAVDLTLVDSDGNELDMGTAFDSFSPKAGHNYKRLSNKILKNRLYLKNKMIESGFAPLSSEWWHYNLDDKLIDDVANFNWNCD